MDKKSIKNIIKIIVIIMVLLVLGITKVNATELVLKLKTVKDSFNLSEDVDITVDWTENLQAAGFTLTYDAEKLLFQGASINDVYYNKETKGTIVVNWYSAEEIDYKKVNFKFKAMATGSATVQITGTNGFANGDLEMPTSVNYTTYGTKTIEINNNYGDINSNGSINKEDYDLLEQYLKGEKELKDINQENADVNLDRCIDSIDLELIKKHIENNLELPIIYGDIDGDGITNGKDILSFKDIESFTEKQKIVADLNLNEKVDDMDLEILRKYTEYYDDEAQLYTVKLPAKCIKNLNKAGTIYSGIMTTKNGITKKEFINKYVNTSDIYSIVLKKGNQEITDENSLIGTGTKVYIKDLEGSKETEIGTVLIYGDTNGDGKIDAVDALALIKDINKKIEFTDEIYKEAGRIISKAENGPTAVDALAIVKYVNGKYTINQDKNAKNKIKTLMEIGEEITIDEDSFYVISDNRDVVTLLKKTLLTEYEKSEFSTNNFWGDEEVDDIRTKITEINKNKATALNIAETYGSSLGGTGRLLLKSEIDNFGLSNDILYGTEGKKLKYWLGSANISYPNCVWCVDGESSSMPGIHYGNDFAYGIRPVIEIWKNKIEEDI